MKKNINVILYEVNKSILDMEGVTISENLKEIYGYDAISSNYGILADISLQDAKQKDKFQCLSNDKELPYTVLDSKEISVNYRKCKLDAKIPEYGLTINNNLNIQFINIPKDRIDSNLSEKILSIASQCVWGMDGNLHYANKVYSKTEFEEILNEVADSNGITHPIVFSVESDIKPYYYTLDAYLFGFLGLEYLQTKILSYVDVSYIEKISQSIFDSLQSLRTNNYYTRLSEVDYTDDFITSNEEKLSIIDEYKKSYKGGKHLKNSTKIVIDKIDEVLFYFFKEKYQSRNTELLDSICSHDYPKSYPLNERKDYLAGDLSISDLVYRYIVGYVDGEDCKFPEDIEAKNIIFDKTIDFDPAIYALETTDFISKLKSSKAENVKFIIEQYGEMSVLNPYLTEIVGIDKLEKFIECDKISVNILTEKQ